MQVLSCLPDWTGYRWNSLQPEHRAGFTPVKEARYEEMAGVGGSDFGKSPPARGLKVNDRIRRWHLCALYGSPEAENAPRLSSHRATRRSKEDFSSCRSQLMPKAMPEHDELPLSGCPLHHNDHYWIAVDQHCDRRCYGDVRRSIGVGGSADAFCCTELPRSILESVSTQLPFLLR
eukprot:768058-Hanusia_phi.AAC.1